MPYPHLLKTTKVGKEAHPARLRERLIKVAEPGIAKDLSPLDRGSSPLLNNAVCIVYSFD